MSKPSCKMGRTVATFTDLGEEEATPFTTHSGLKAQIVQAQNSPLMTLHPSPPPHPRLCRLPGWGVSCCRETNGLDLAASPQDPLTTGRGGGGCREGAGGGTEAPMTRAE